ncbi:ABC transporter ATP-binding protein [Leptothoe sp. PORK10 BA2]|uniref:ABC transporter ATP-binding protein n=1 Tax=Leptothoe sp. PORK10 BA2 TaxID=3110254 RepID=UPI002B1EC279|nr:ABC transporter ATP-binding protein [Leptothoe sp. PORK10 BA2]MEA5463493.1 ABC transporter ATP-binding protein [Leptothoe sp. PORK10 BA2]
MSDTVIQVENLGKKYIIGQQQESSYSYKALRDVLADSAKSLGRRLRHPGKPFVSSNQEEFWALKELSFEIKQGEVVGIIGRNGAGKSTLLKILSRITEPTTGRIRLRGRVASLLEVGTGFHPELTGRENIFLNGAILGMSRVEINRKFDKIVEFAEIAKFLDTPVKRYSSGMYVRLAFAVAAHLEPEILVIDEVLAVGDVAFQKKCLGKIENIARREQRTVLFVSHQMAAIKSLCSRVIVLDSGQLKIDNSPQAGINFYLKNLETVVNRQAISALRRTGTGALKLIDFWVEDSSSESIGTVVSGSDITLKFSYYRNTIAPLNKVVLGFSLHTSLGDILSIVYSDYMGVSFSNLSTKGEISCQIKDLNLSKGRYYVGVRILVNQVEADWPRGYVGFIDVEDGNFYAEGRTPHSGIGPILIRGKWQATDTSKPQKLLTKNDS